MYKVTVYIILELRLLLVPKYHFNITCVCTHTLTGHKWLKHGAKFDYPLYYLNICIRYIFLVLTFTKQPDRYYKVIKLPQTDLKSRSNVHNEVWTKCAKADLTGELLTVWGRCDREAISYRKYDCNETEIKTHKFNIDLLIPIQNKSTSKTP